MYLWSIWNSWGRNTVSAVHIQVVLLRVDMIYFLVIIHPQSIDAYTINGSGCLLTGFLWYNIYSEIVVTVGHDQTFGLHYFLSP